MVTGVSGAGAGGRTTTAGKVEEAGSDLFMKLLVAQLRFQDPMKPMEGTEFTSQLAQFSTLDRLGEINKNITGLKDAQLFNMRSDAAGFLGKNIISDGSIITLGEEGADYMMDLEGEAAEVQVKIFDQEGKYIRGQSFFDVGQGRQRFSWDGRNDTSSSMPDGEYTYVVKAFAEDGSEVNVKTIFEGIVDGVTFEDEETYLSVNGMRIKIEDIKEVSGVKTVIQEAIK